MPPRQRIRIGVGAWTYEPWRGTFFPDELPRKQELAFASRALGSIEVNGTYYRTQIPDTFAKWHDETPDDFVFSLKAPRYVTNRRTLAGAGQSIDRFFASGLLRLRDKLGPINWQFMPGKKFDPEDFAAFLKLLPSSIDGRPIRHAVEARDESFRDPEFFRMAREHQIAIVRAGDSRYPTFEETTAPFVYARIMGTTEAEPAGYADDALDRWSRRCRQWARDREVFLYVISGFKQRNPAAALALIQRVTRTPERPPARALAASTAK